MTGMSSSQREDELWVWKAPMYWVDRLALLGAVWLTYQDGGAWPSHQKLAELTGLSTRTIRRALPRLQAAGAIIPTGKQGRQAAYALNTCSSDGARRRR
jgi:DNA-binding transcriptional regulator PaaX